MKTIINNTVNNKRIEFVKKVCVHCDIEQQKNRNCMELQGFGKSCAYMDKAVTGNKKLSGNLWIEDIFEELNKR